MYMYHVTKSLCCPSETITILLMGYVCVSAQLCLTFCSPMDCSLTDSSVHGILQARILLQGIVPTQGSNPGFLHCKRILYCWSHQRVEKKKNDSSEDSLSMAPVIFGRYFRLSIWSPLAQGHRWSRTGYISLPSLFLLLVNRPPDANALASCLSPGWCLGVASSLLAAWVMQGKP